MIDTTEQKKWLKEWVKDDPDNLGTDLETRSFNSLEVEVIMQIYSSEVVKYNVALHSVSNSVICCPQCGNERLESTGDGWYICCDKDCDWGDKL